MGKLWSESHLFLALTLFELKLQYMSSCCVDVTWPFHWIEKPNIFGNIEWIPFNKTGASISACDRSPVTFTVTHTVLNDVFLLVSANLSCTIRWIHNIVNSPRKHTTSWIQMHYLQCQCMCLISFRKSLLIISILRIRSLIVKSYSFLFRYDTLNRKTNQ